MSYTPKNAASSEPERCQLRAIERWYRELKDRSFSLQDWHFKLKEHLSPQQIVYFLGAATWNGRHTLTWPNTKSGKAQKRYAQEKLRWGIESAMGIKQFLIEGEKAFDRYLSKEEINLMFQLSARAMAGEKIDSYEELARFRGQK